MSFLYDGIALPQPQCGRPGLLFLVTLLLKVGIFPAADGQPLKRTVLIMRHCVRSTPNDGLFEVAGRDMKFDDYSELKWPSFDVNAMQCVPRGLDLVKAHGTWFRQHAQLHQPVFVIADDYPRDKATADAFVDGLGLTGEVASLVDKTRFTEGKMCKWGAEDKMPLLVANLAAHPPFPDMEKELQEVKAIVGTAKDAATDWTKAPCSAAFIWPSWAKERKALLVGACKIGYELVERLFMQWGAGTEVGWGRVKPESLPRLMRLMAWYDTVVRTIQDDVRHTQATFGRAVLEDLNDSYGGTTIYVGHDTQLSALQGMLGITWQADPFPDDITLPGSILRIDREENVVRAQYIYLDDFSKDGSEMKNTTVLFQNDEEHLTSMPFSVFNDRIQQGTEPSCVYNDDSWVPILYLFIFLIVGLLIGGFGRAKECVSRFTATPDDEDADARINASIQMLEVSRSRAGTRASGRDVHLLDDSAVREESEDP